MELFEHGGVAGLGHAAPGGRRARRGGGGGGPPRGGGGGRGGNGREELAAERAPSDSVEAGSVTLATRSAHRWPVAVLERLRELVEPRVGAPPGGLVGRDACDKVGPPGV